MVRLPWFGWRRDLLVALLSALLTLTLCIPVAWAYEQSQETGKARARVLLAQQNRTEACDQAQRSLLEQANALLRNFGGGVADADAEVFEVSTAAVSPEVQEGASLLIDKKATIYQASDIVVYRVEGRNYLGRVIALDEAIASLTIGRNGEPDRQVSRAELLGRCILNTR